MTIKDVERLLDGDTPTTDRERQFTAALREALTGLLCIGNEFVPDGLAFDPIDHITHKIKQQLLGVYWKSKITLAAFTDKELAAEIQRRELTG